MSETQNYKTVTFATEGEVVAACLGLHMYINYLDSCSSPDGYANWPNGAKMRADAVAAKRAIEK